MRHSMHRCRFLRHMPLTLDTKKAKISKRSHGEIVAVQFYRDNGFIPWAFNNFLALLGWSAGNDQEFFSKEELIREFSLERINKSSAIFNYQKNDPKFFTDPKAIFINEHYLRTMDIGELGEMVKKELESADLWHDAYDAEQKDWYLQTLDLIRDRFHTLKDFTTLGRAYFADDFTVEAKPLAKNVLKYPDLQQWLPQLADRYEATGRFHPGRNGTGGQGTGRRTGHQTGHHHQCHAHRGHRPTCRSFNV